MDGERFDALAKALATGVSRRGLVQGVAGGSSAGSWRRSARAAREPLSAALAASPA